MRDFAATFHDGRTATAHAVTVRATPAGLRIFGADGLLIAFWKTADLRAGGQLPGSAGVRVRCVAEPDARLMVPDAEFIRTVAPAITTTGRDRGGWIMFVAASAAIVAVGIAVVFGLPAASRHLAALVPPSLEAEWGESLAAGLEAQWGACRAPAGDAALGLVATRLAAALPDFAKPRRVVVVRHEAVNALALPGGTILIFQGLLDAAEGPDEVAGVLAHEMTHVSERHVTAAAIRGLGVGVLVTLVTGDASGAVAGAAATLLSGAYSREDEAAADSGAVALLNRAGISAAGLARFFRRIGEKETGLLPEWLSTHPDPWARAAAVDSAAASRPAAAAMSAEQWAALRRICR